MDSFERLKVGDSVRHINGDFGYIGDQSEEGFIVHWGNGQVSQPLLAGYLEKVKSGLTILGR